MCFSCKKNSQRLTPPCSDFACGGLKKSSDDIEEIHKGAKTFYVSLTYHNFWRRSLYNPKGWSVGRSVGFVGWLVSRSVREIFFSIEEIHKGVHLKS